MRGDATRGTSASPTVVGIAGGKEAMRTRRLRRAATTAGLLALLVPAAAGAKAPVFTGSVTATTDNAICGTYGVTGTASWSHGKVDQVIIDVGGQTQAPLAAGGRTRGSLGFTYSGVQIPDGNVVVVRAYFYDAAGNETGRASTSLGACTVGQPDLVPQSIAFTGVDHNYTVTVLNQGNATADISGMGVQGYYDPAAGTWPGADGACGTSVNPNTTLGIGATITIPVTCSGAPGAGDAFLNVKVDAGDTVVESDESNNVGSIALP